MPVVDGEEVMQQFQSHNNVDRVKSRGDRYLSPQLTAGLHRSLGFTEPMTPFPNFDPPTPPALLREYF